MTSSLTLNGLPKTREYASVVQQGFDTPRVRANSRDDTFESPPVSSVAQSRPATKTLATELCEFGQQLAASPRTIGTGFTLAPGVALGLRLEGSVHTRASSLISDNPFRLAATTLLEKKNPRHSVVWSQTGGVTELGVGLNCTLPLSQFASLQFGFAPSTLLRYRRIQPHILGFFETKASVLKQNGGVFPFSSSMAKNLSAGSEYELAGLGRIGLSASLSGNLGTPSFPSISAGVGSSVFSEEAITHEVALNVLALDGANKVRVQLRKTDEQSARLGAKLYAGFSSQLAASLPAIGQGLLQKGAAWLGGNVADALIAYFATLSLQASTSSASKDSVIATFDFDLSESAACSAYDEFMKLSCMKADTLSAKEGSGVKQLKQTQQEHTHVDEFSASLFGDKLVLLQALSNEKQGLFRTPDGNTTLYRQANFKKHESGWFDPTRDILWETVSLKDQTSDTAKSFFHFRYQKSGELREQEYDDFFKIGRCLSLPPTNGHKDKESRRLICQSFEASLTTDLYFSQNGILSIAQSSEQQATNAFLLAAGNMRPELALLPLQERTSLWPKLEALIKKHIAEHREGWFLNFGYFDRLALWESQYEKLCGRSLEEDACTFANALEFAERVALIKDATNTERIKRFFVSLGEAKGFTYQISIAALAMLAGDKDTLVHQHELKGNGLVFKYEDEGKIEEPSEIIKSLLSKLL